MVGLDNAGKTTILYQFLMNEVVHTSPTIGSNVEEVGQRGKAPSQMKSLPINWISVSAVYFLFFLFLRLIFRISSRLNSPLLVFPRHAELKADTMEPFIGSQWMRWWDLKPAMVAVSTSERRKISRVNGNLAFILFKISTHFWMGKNDDEHRNADDRNFVFR